MISRYTQPAQSQYIPMDMNTYQMMGQAALKAGEQPWNLISAIKERQYKESAQSNALLDMMTTNIGGIKAINNPDKQRLIGEKKKYESAINKAVDQYQDNPSALLSALTTINRDFKANVAGGVLGDINTRYKVGMEDLKQIKKDISSGKLSPEGADVAKQLLGTGYTVPRTGDIDSSAKAMLSGNNGAIGTGNMKQAYMKEMKNKYGRIYTMLNETGKKYMLSQFEDAWNLYGAPKYGNSGNVEEKDRYWDPVAHPEEGRDKFRYPKLYETQRWSDDGSTVIGGSNNKTTKKVRDYLTGEMVDAVEAQPIATFGPSPSVPEGASREYTSEQVTSQINKFVDDYNIPKTAKRKGKTVTLTLKERYEMAKRAADSLSNKNYIGRKMKNIKGFDSIKLFDEKNGLRSFAGQKVIIDGKEVDGADVYKTLADKLGVDKKNNSKLAAQLKDPDTRAEVVIGGKDALHYKWTIPNANGEDVVITAPITDTEITGYLRPVAYINNAINNRQLNKVVPMRGMATVTVETDNGPKPEAVSAFKVVYDGSTNEPVVLAYKRDKNGNDVPIMTTHNGKKQQAAIDMDYMTDKALGKIRMKNRSFAK